MVALTYRASVDVPARFRKSKAVGAVFGLTPGALLAVVTVKITLSTAALMTKVEKRLAKYPSKRIIPWACGRMSRSGEARPCR